MTKIGSDPFKNPFKVYADSESEIRFSKKTKKNQKTKNHDFCYVHSDRNFVLNQTKIFFSNSAPSYNPEKIVLKKIRTRQKLIKIWTF